MEMKITLSIEEAKALCAKALAPLQVGDNKLEVTEVEWRSYSTSVVFTLETVAPPIVAAPGDDL